MELKVNVFNRLRKIREGVLYDSNTSFIDELLQNCQRSYETSSDKTSFIVEVEIEDDHIIVRDTGEGCESPESILTFDQSGWDSSMITDAYGQGGSESLFQISDRFKITSRNWSISCDVEQLLESEKLDIQIEYPENYFEGYEVVMSGELISNNLEIFIDYFRNAMKLLPMRCILNGDEVEKIDLHHINSKFTQKFSNDLFEATLGIGNSYRDIGIYYERRKVKDAYYNGIVGAVELRRNAVTLKAPDRKSFVYDDKLIRFEKEIKKCIKSLLLNFIKTDPFSAFDDYTSQIAVYLDVEDYINYLPDPSKSVKPIFTQMDKCTPAGVCSYQAIESNDPNQVKLVKINKSNENCDSEEITIKNAIHRNYKKFKNTITNPAKCIWVRSSEYPNYESQIKLLSENYGITILVSKNVLYDKAYDYLKVSHISAFLSKYQIVTKYSSTSSDYTTHQREDRLRKVLNLISSHYDLGCDVFKLVKVTEHLKYNGKTASKIEVPYSIKSGKIMLNRDFLNLDKYETEYYSKDEITRNDVLVILGSITSIAGGLSQLIYNTVPNTISHYNKTNEIIKEISILLTDEGKIAVRKEV